MHFSTIALSALSLVGTASAHMIMGNPVPYGKSSLNNSPLMADGSDFPCKQRSGVYDAQGASNVLPAGSTQTLSFIGSAVHGGGSCQLSVTTDPQPSKSSVWRVIHSIEGGCPARDQAQNLAADPNGTGSSKYQWTVPAGLAGGNYTLAWTWFNRVGNREMYMNCAPLTVTGSSSKIKARSEDIIKRDTAAFLSTLPNMFVANIGNGCNVAESKNVQFPNPGLSVEKNDAFGFEDPTGSCGGVAAAVAPAGGSSATAAAAPPAVATTPAAVASSSNVGGVFVPISTATVSPIAAAPTTMATVVAASSSMAAPAAVATGTTGSSNTSSSGAMPQGGACSPEGTWNCLPGGKTYQQCGSGLWTPVMPLAAGTSCQPGMGALKMVAARSVRYPKAHNHRRHHS